MGTLSTPSGADIVNLFIGVSGSVPAIGGYNEEAIDNDVTTNTPHSIPETELFKINEELDASGLDSGNLTIDQETYANLALLWACVYQYRQRDRIMRIASGQKCEEEKDFMAGQDAIRLQIVNALHSIGARSKYYSGYLNPDSPVSIHNGDLVDYSEPNNIVTWQ